MVLALGLGARGGGSLSIGLGASNGSGSSPGVVGGGGAGGFRRGVTGALEGIEGEVGDAPPLSGGGAGGLRRWFAGCGGGVGNVNLLGTGDRIGEIGAYSEVNAWFTRPTSPSHRDV